MGNGLDKSCKGCGRRMTGKKNKCASCYRKQLAFTAELGKMPAGTSTTTTATKP